MMEARSVDIVMIDLVRVGGITQWLKVAGMAEAFNLPVVSHLIPEVHVHLIGAVPNGLTVEYMPWLLPLFKEVPESESGELVMPTAPGWGLRFDEKAVERFRGGLDQRLPQRRLRLPHDLRKARRIVIGDRRQHLAVDLDACLVQPVDKAAIGQAMFPHRRVDALDP